MKKRILTVLLAVCLVFALGTVTALADDPAVAEDGVYTSLPAAGSDGVIKLDKDVVLETSAVIEGNIILDLNGHSITASDSWPSKDNTYDYLIGVERGATLTVRDSGSGGIIDATNNNADKLAVAIKLTLKGEDATGNVARLIIESGIIKGTSYGISGNGARHNTSLSISGGQVIATEGVGIYNPQEGTVDIRGGSITGVASAIELRSGTLNISGGTFTATANEYKEEQNSNGTTVTGAAIAISQHTTRKAISVTISGGTFNGVYALRETDVQNPDTVEDIEIVSISNGTFNGKVSSEDCVGFIKGGTFTDTSDEGFNSYLAPGLDIGSNGDVVISEDAVAKVGNDVYTDLQDAIDAAEASTTDKTVTLLKDVSVSAAGLGNTKGAITITGNITLDGDTHTISITSIDAGATPSAINIQNSANVTLKDLTIDSNGAKHGLNINNNANVTLENVKILDSAQYAIVCNSSKLTVNGLYTQGNAWGINVDSKTAGVKSNVTINNATINEKDSIVFENTNNVGSNVIINDGTFNNIKKQGNNTTTGVDVDVNGGTFGMDITNVANEYPNYQVRIGNNYSYYDDADDALNAAGTTGVVTYVGPSTTDTHDVTLYYDKDHVVTLEVADEGVIYLPSGYFDGKHIDGWDERYGGNYKPGAKVTVERDMYFTVILRNGQYNIVIDNDIKHGDVSTDVSSADKGATVYIYVDPDIGYVLDDLDVCYGANNRYSVTVSYVRAGVYKFTMPNASVYITATFKYAALPFTDVNRNQWFYDEVFYVYTNGMMEGDSTTTFNPDGRMTRAMFWAVLGRIDGATITGNDWAEEARAWAMREGVSDGTNPNDYVTREQMVTMLWRYAGEKNGSASLIRYTDADKISSYAVEAMRWAIGNGIIEGMTSTTLEPQGTATRAQCAAIFMRFDQM